MQSEDLGRIRAQISELQQAMMVLGQATYGGATAPGWQWAWRAARFGFTPDRQVA